MKAALPLLFLHAASYTRAMWLPQRLALQGEFPVLAVDLPAHGALARTPFSLRAAVDTIGRALDDAGAARAVLVGASLGGCVGMAFAAEQPERVAGLALAGCTFNPCRPLAQMILTGEGVVFPRGGARFTRALHLWLRAHFAAPIAEEIIAGGTYWRGAAQAVLALRGVDLRARLSVYPGPVLIVNGRRDWVHRSSEAAFAGAARRCRVIVIDGAGHLPSLEAPGVFTEVVRGFAGGL